MALSLALAIVCQLLSTNEAVRWNDDRRDSGECRAIATPDESLGFRASAFEADFSFLRSRNFFVSSDASCASPVEMERKVPKTLRAKEVLLEQRYAVKQLKEGFEAMSKQKGDYFRHVGVEHFNLAGQAGEVDTAPAVELQMFPEDPLNASSRWKALVVPRVREVFGDTLYLCETDRRCVAEIRFENLPFRFLSWLKQWQPFLERTRSTPHHVVLLGELLVMAGVISFVGILAYATLQLWKVWPHLHKPCLQPDFEVPKAYRLLRHVYVHGAPGQRPSKEPLDAGAKIEILELQHEAAQGWQLWVLKAQALLGFREVPGLWARVASPSGWIMIWDKAGDDRLCLEGVMPPWRFVTDAQLLPPVLHFGRSSLLLVASYFSALYFIIQQSFNSAVLTISLALFGLHGLALHQKLDFFLVGLLSDQALENGHLLPSPQPAVPRWAFDLAAALLFAGSWACVAPSACAMLLLALAVHVLQLHAAQNGQRNWRKPQVQCHEYHKISIEQLPQSQDVPELSADRSLKLAGVRLFTVSLIILAGAALGFGLVDGCQLRGELVDYSFNRGHLVYPAEGQGFHNTLLVDSAADSLVLSLQASPNSQQIQLKVQHPLMPKNESFLKLGTEKSGEYQIFLPSGPLYSQIYLTAISGNGADTSYTFHVLRLGGAVNMSIEGSFDRSKYPEVQSPFQETRRLAYLLRHPNWYIPDIDRQSNTSFVLTFSPVVYAPLAPVSRASADTPAIADTCHCGEDRSGLGNGCSIEELTPVSATLANCIYVRDTLGQLVLDQAGSVSGNTAEMATWLANIAVSGRSVALLPWAEDSQYQKSAPVAYFAAEEATMRDAGWTNLGTTFRLLMPVRPLIGEPARLLIAPTADPTDAEAASIPLALIPHAPPIRLEPIAALVPAFEEHDLQKDYAWCNWTTIQDLTGKIDDERFMVDRKRMDTKEACEGEVEGLEFQAVRVHACMDWCSTYLPRAETYDVSAVRSGLRCLKDAVASNNVMVLQRVMANGILSGKEECIQQLGLLGDAIRRHRNVAVKTLVENEVDPTQTSLGEMPLAIAAEVGNIQALQLLLEKNVPVDQRNAKGETALFEASRHCQQESLKFLLDNRSDATAESWVPFGSSESGPCNETVLIAAITDHDRSHCEAEGAQLQDVVKLLETYGAKLRSSCNDRGRAMKKCLLRQDLEAMRLLLEAERTPLTEADYKLLVQTMISNRQLKSGFLTGALKLLAESGTHLERPLEQQVGKYGDTLLTVFAMKCKVELVETCLQLGADPAALNGNKQNASEAASRYCRQKAAKAKILQLVANHTRPPKDAAKEPI